jgi:hypothetical protein
MSVFSKLKHRGMTHSNFLLTVTVQTLSVEGVVLPEFLFLKWGTTRQKGVLKTALIQGKKATWDETFTISVTFYNYPGNPQLEKKFLNVRIVHRSAKIFGTVDIELTQFANIDGERTKIFPVNLESGTGTAQLQVTIKTLWINDGDNMPHRPRSITNMSNLSLTSVSEASEKADTDSYENTWTDEGSEFNDDKRIESDALSWIAPHHGNKERAEELMQVVGMHITAEDILFLINQMTTKEQDKVTMAVRARSEMPHPQLKEKSVSGIPNDLLYAIMNKADVGVFLSENMRNNPTHVEAYLNQLCSLVLFCKNDFPRLETFLLQTCALSIHFALQVYWFFVAALGRKMELDENLQQQAMRLKIAIINAVEGTEGASNTSENFKMFQEEIEFTDTLIKIGKEMVNLQHEKRKPTLLENLTKHNDTFFGEGQKKKRVYIPLCNSHDPRKYVIRFVPEHCTVFGTAHRAPYLVFCEAFEETSAHPFPKIVIAEEEISAPPSPSTSEAKKAQKLEAKRLKEEKKKQKRTEAEHGSSFEAAMAMGEELVSPRHKDSPRHEGKGKDVEDDGASSATADAETISLKEQVLGKLLWSRKVNAIRSASPHGSDPRWCIVSAIVKSGDDLRQEKLAVQLIEQIYTIFLEFKLPLFIHPYKVLATSSEDGMIETVTNAMTLDSIKQLMKPNATLLDYFRLLYGAETSKEFKKARENFVVSMAGYSLVCYMLQIKDRHNGNIMLDAEGHIIHIDFGFILSKKQIRLLNVNFEAAPFKLTQEFIDVMGGTKSSSYKYYKYLMQKGYRKLRKRHYKLTMLVDIVASTTDLPCLTDRTTAELESRFNLYMSKKQSNKFISSQIKEAMRSTTTRTYDFFNQKRFGIRA